MSETQLPKILIFETSKELANSLENNRQYRLYIGRRHGEIVILTFSTQNELITQAMLLLKDIVAMDSVEFEHTTVCVDVFVSEHSHNGKPTAKFWCENVGHAYVGCPAIEPYLRDGMEAAWKDVLGFNTSFYPYGGPSDPDKVHLYPDFMQ